MKTYSQISHEIKHSAEICEKGFAYLLGHDNVTARRIEYLEKMGFYITKFHLCKVMKWFGMSVFVVWEKKTSDFKGIIDYDRNVWKMD